MDPDPAHRLEDHARSWDVHIEEVSSTPTSLLARGHRRGDPVVLKMVRRPGEEWDGGRVADAFRGCGVVHVLEHAPGAALLERLEPGTPLEGVVLAGRDDEATETLASVVREMARASPPVGGFATAESWGDAFGRYEDRGDERIPPALVTHARERYQELCASQSHRRLLHGDLHHGNVLHDRRRGWVAVDPKGVVAELEYELGAALRNPLGALELQASLGPIRRRVERFAGELPVDRNRVLEWAYVQAVLAVVWMVEDHVPIRRDNPALRLARTLAPPHIQWEP